MLCAIQPLRRERRAPESRYASVSIDWVVSAGFGDSQRQARVTPSVRVVGIGELVVVGDADHELQPDLDGIVRERLDEEYVGDLDPQTSRCGHDGCRIVAASDEPVSFNGNRLTSEGTEYLLMCFSPGERFSPAIYGHSPLCRDTQGGQAPL